MDKELIKNMRQAVKQGDIITVKNMLETNEDLIDVETPFGTWLQVASAHGQVEIVRYLIECGMDINKSVGISDGAPIKSAAIYNGHFDVIKFLVEKGIALDVCYAIGDLDKVDAYEYARQYGQTEIANFLKNNM